MLSEDTMEKIRKSIVVLNDDIDYRKTKVNKWLAVSIVGTVGTILGLLSMHGGRLVAGGSIAIFSSFLTLINCNKLMKLNNEKNMLCNVLESPELYNEVEENFDEDLRADDFNNKNNKGGKHFKK